MTPIGCETIRSSKAHRIFNVKYPLERATLDDSKNMYINVVYFYSELHASKFTQGSCSEASELIQPWTACTMRIVKSWKKFVSWDVRHS